MSLAPCPSCSRHVRLSEAACPFCATPFARVHAPTAKLGIGVSRAMLVFGGVVALSAAIEACGETVPAAASLYGAPPAIEDAGTAVPTPDPSAMPAPSTSPPPSATTSASGSSSAEPSMASLYGAPPVPPAKADAGAHKPMAPAAAYGAPPSFVPPPKDGPTPKKR